MPVVKEEVGFEDEEEKVGGSSPIQQKSSHKSITEDQTGNSEVEDNPQFQSSAEKGSS